MKLLNINLIYTYSQTLSKGFIIIIIIISSSSSICDVRNKVVNFSTILITDIVYLK
jgi:hypothetical protein